MHVHGGQGGCWDRWALRARGPSEDAALLRLPHPRSPPLSPAPQGAVLAHRWALRLSLGVCPIQSPSAGGTLSGTFTRSRGAMPSARPRARCRGWSAGAPARAGAAAGACGRSGGSSPSSAATGPPSRRRWRSPASVAAPPAHSAPCPRAGRLARSMASGRPGLGSGRRQVAPGWLDPPGWAGAPRGPGSFSPAEPEQLGAERAGEAGLQTALSGSALHKEALNKCC